jgi:hypothetical protein
MQKALPSTGRVLQRPRNCGEEEARANEGSESTRRVQIIDQGSASAISFETQRVDKKGFSGWKGLEPTSKTPRNLGFLFKAA